MGVAAVMAAVSWRGTKRRSLHDAPTIRRGSPAVNRKSRWKSPEGRVLPCGHAMKTTDSATFHPAVTAWFERRFPAGPTGPQARAWPAILEGRSVLIAAPTGSGKTLAAFLAAIDGLVRQAVAGRLDDATQVVYVSPLKALSNDIQRNLQEPLAGIGAGLREMG